MAGVHSRYYLGWTNWTCFVLEKTPDSQANIASRLIFVSVFKIGFRHLVI